MDFFARQDSARRRTALLLLLFTVAVGATVLVVYGLFRWLPVVFSGAGGSLLRQRFWIPTLLLWTAVPTVLLVLFGSVWKIAQLDRGGVAIAELLDARRVQPNSTRPDERRLLNVVEEMAVASGLPVPPVYVLDCDGINALTAGFAAADTVVCVTRGALRALSREELQGVVGHEFSHIVNGDGRLDLQLVGLLHGLLCIALAGRLVLEIATEGDIDDWRGVAALGIIGGLLWLAGMTGWLASSCIRAAVCRQRERLADAAAVQFTRHPLALAGALRKIGGLLAGSHVPGVRAGEVGHMFICTAAPAGQTDFFDTHPPLAERIRWLDPQFDGRFPPYQLPPEPEETGPGGAGAAAPPMEVSVVAPAFASSAPAAAAADALAEESGVAVREYVARAQALIAALPRPLRAAAREPSGARAVIYALLLDRGPAVRERQWTALEQRLDPALLAEVRQFVPLAADLPPEARWPLADLCLPALKLLSLPQFREFKEGMDLLIGADGSIDLFEYVLARTLGRVLSSSLEGAARTRTRILSLPRIAQEASVLLTCMARAGQADETRARLAFEASVRALPAPAGNVRFLPAAEAGLEAVDDALARLLLAAPALRRRLIDACLKGLLHDGRAADEEVQLLRAIAAALDCPLPAWVEGPAS